MKYLLVLICLASIQTAVAGSYNFECVAYNLDKADNSISKLELSRERAVLDNVRFEIKDPNIDLLEGVQTYANSKGSSVLSAEVKAQLKTLSLEGNIGPRDHIVEMYNVEINASINGSKKLFTGTCTETTITTCGGPCN